LEGVRRRIQTILDEKEKNNKLVSVSFYNRGNRKCSIRFLPDEFDKLGNASGTVMVLLLGM
jgi:hypothetical protein